MAEEMVWRSLDDVVLVPFASSTIIHAVTHSYTYKQAKRKQHPYSATASFLFIVYNSTIKLNLFYKLKKKKNH